MVRRLPGLIPQLLQSLRSDNFSGAQLSRSIESDVVLLSAVIRMANTAYIGTSTRVNSVEHAVMLIGQEGLRQLITSVAFRPIINLHSGRYTSSLAPRIWDQSERAAVANRVRAQTLGLDPFEAFLAGLVQNVGMIVTLRIMDQVDKEGGKLGSELFCASLMKSARSLSLNIAREWNFPDSVVKAIGEQGQVRKGVEISPLGQLLAQSDYLSKLRVLIDTGRMSFDAALLRGLSPETIAVYEGLHAVLDDVPAIPPAQVPSMSL
jgi:HD-like signal output (HDOD) protein